MEIASDDNMELDVYSNLNIFQVGNYTLFVAQPMCFYII